MFGQMFSNSSISNTSSHTHSPLMRAGRKSRVQEFQILAEVMMNPSKGGCVSGRFSRTTTGGSSTSSASDDNTFCPYESRRDDAVTVYDMNVEAWPTGT